MTATGPLRATERSRVAPFHEGGTADSAHPHALRKGGVSGRTSDWGADPVGRYSLSRLSPIRWAGAKEEYGRNAKSDTDPGSAPLIVLGRGCAP